MTSWCGSFLTAQLKDYYEAKAVQRQSSSGRGQHPPLDIQRWPISLKGKPYLVSLLLFILDQSCPFASVSPFRIWA